MEHIVRPRERGDWGEIVEIFFQGIQSNNSTFHYECPSYEEWDAIHTKDCRLVIEDGDEVVGFAALTPFSSRECYKGVASVSIYIDGDHQHGGYGTELLSALVAESEKCGYWTLEASIFETNAPSIKLHEKCGFRVVGVRERLGKDRFGVWRSVVLMERRIQTDKAGGCDCAQMKKAQAEQAEREKHMMD